MTKVIIAFLCIWGWGAGFLLGYGLVYASILTPETVITTMNDVRSLNFVKNEHDKQAVFLDTMLKDAQKPIVGVIP